MKQALAIYLRLSDEDIDLKKNAAKDESNSISAQRSIILQRVNQEPSLRELPRLEFCDDGYSGTNFDRPEFQRMIDLVRQGLISCIVVKDLSRFGRDYLEVGNYLEHFFPFLGIRFLSVNDQYDSADHDGQTVGMDIAFRNLVYDYYSRDLSTKVKSAMRTRQEKGEYVSCVPYGYQRSKANKHRLVVDEPAAKVVREIFSLVLSGKSTSQVAAILNERGLQTPQVYKGGCRHDETPPQWTRSCITRMIRNIKYTGAMVTHIRESQQIRAKSQKTVPKEEQFLHLDMHEAIIPWDTWEKANQMLPKRSVNSKSPSDQTERIYYCAHCGRKLQKSNSKDTYFYCPSAKFHAQGRCDSIHLNQNQAEDTLAAVLKVQLNFLTQTEAEEVKQKGSESSQLYRSIQQLEKSLTLLQQKKLERYEAYRRGEISREDFLAIKDDLSNQADDLTDEKERLEAEYQTLLANRQSQTARQQEAAQAIQILDDYTSGLKEHLYEAVQKVIVTDNEHIEIQWNFQDLLAS